MYVPCYRLSPNSRAIASSFAIAKNLCIGQLLTVRSIASFHQKRAGRLEAARLQTAEESRLFALFIRLPPFNQCFTQSLSLLLCAL